jgi:heme/copper-type cytochrome/quinol oxidase subunit 4
LQNQNAFIAKGDSVEAFRKGWVVAVLLAVLTVVEYLFAINFDSKELRFAGLSGAALIKATLIIIYFMHVSHAWAPVEEYP